MKTTNARELAAKLKISPARSLEATFKADLIDAILQTVRTEGLTHAELAEKSGVSRSAVTGILSGSLQKVSLDRVLRLVEAAGLWAEVKVKRAA